MYYLHLVAQKSSLQKHRLISKMAIAGLEVLRKSPAMAAAKLAKELGGKAELQVRHGHGTWNGALWAGDRMRIGRKDGSCWLDVHNL